MEILIVFQSISSELNSVYFNLPVSYYNGEAQSHCLFTVWVYSRLQSAIPFDPVIY